MYIDNVPNLIHSGYGTVERIGLWNETIKINDFKKEPLELKIVGWI